MRIKKNKGFTLVELLLAVMILAGAIGGALLLFTTSMLSSEQAWDTTIATSHGEHILEGMQALDSLEAILTINWKDWITQQRLNTLPGEVIDITFSDSDTNLLDILIKVNWTRKSRINHVVLKTKLTK